MNTTKNTKIENITAGMTIILEGRTHAVEVLTIDNWTNAAVFQIGHMGKGFAVTNVPAGSLVKVAA